MTGPRLTRDEEALEDAADREPAPRLRSVLGLGLPPADEEASADTERAPEVMP